MAVLPGAAPGGQTQSAHERIAAAVSPICLIDTHEHLPPEADRLKRPPSLFSLRHYVSPGMWADGMNRGEAERELGSPSGPA